MVHSAPEAPIRPIVTGPMARLLVASIGALGSFYLLMPVVPSYVATGGAGGVGAGLSTGALMLGTVLAELAAPAWVGRWGYRTAMAFALLVLGAPAAVLLISSWPPVVLGVCLVRGAGLGIVFVAGAALAAELAPAGRRSESLGLYGAAVGIPAIACLPAGVWLSGRIGYPPVFLAGAVLALLALAAVPGLPGRAVPADSVPVGSASVGAVPVGAVPVGAVPVGAVSAGSVSAGSVSVGSASAEGLAGPAMVFAAVALVAGVLLTFLPLSLSGASPRLAAVALLVQSCTTPLARWAAGRYGARYGGRMLLPAVVAVAVGTAALAWAPNPWAVLAGVGLFGIGFGVAQNVTLTLMFARVPTSRFAWASALWNLAYDGGMGIGAVGFGLLLGPIGYAAGYLCTAAVLITILVPAWRQRHTGLA
ncbi:MFS transporter [Rhizocola hellebori]|uniref:MFS transporter n=1 Tax=Rhizocola hellebori TaxID=1392758 RepID=A0A8J3Q3X7_9ACTN|nr:MFS transporter [Rhizocola hellebori]GIH03032.1 MFS transporter [Rhizocola hellebori]